MDWDNLQVFLTIARTGRISAAARRLGVEHTTVSRRLDALEKELGVPLFYRTTTGYMPTAHAKNMIANAETMERAAIAVAARAREGSGAVAGRVRLAMAPEFASHWLAPQLPAFRARYPQIDLQILVGTRERDLTRGEAELSIQSPRPRQQGLVTVRVAHTAAALYASKTLLGGKKLWIERVEDLRGLSLLVYTPAYQMLQEAKWFQPVLASANIGMETNSTHTLLAAARAAAGVAVLPHFVAQNEPALVSVSETVAHHDVWLITHPELRRDPKVRVTADFLKRIAAGPKGLS